MSTYVPKNSRHTHKPIDHSKNISPEDKRRGLIFAGISILVGPPLLVGGLIAVWWAVAWIIVGVFKVLPLIKA